jgi:hypothetical protein
MERHALSYERSSGVKVTFKRTGERRYRVLVAVSGQSVQGMNPAPGYDDDIPHDLVHYIVEAELGLTSGVFGRAARGAGTFVAARHDTADARERARKRRRQKKREQGMARRDETSDRDMATSERFTALCDVAWRRLHGQHADPLRTAPELAAPEDAAKIERVVARLDQVAPLWRALPDEGELVFVWPSAAPLTV